MVLNSTFGSALIVSVNNNPVRIGQITEEGILMVELMKYEFGILQELKKKFPLRCTLLHLMKKRA